LSHLVHGLVGCLELGLEILVDLVRLLHLLIDQELVWDLERHKEFGGISPSLKFGQLGHEPVQQVLDSALLTMHDVPLERRVEVRRVAKHFEEATDALLGLVLGFALDVDTLVRLVQVA